ncbi:hypothetical protein ABKN59_004581 [Abortiporus biennis]
MAELRREAGVTSVTLFIMCAHYHITNPEHSWNDARIAIPMVTAYNCRLSTHSQEIHTYSYELEYKIDTTQHLNQKSDSVAYLALMVRKVLVTLRREYFD